MADRRQRALALLERLRKLEIESVATELNELRGRMADLERRRDETTDALYRDGHIVSLESAPYVGNYIRAARSEIASLEAAHARLAPREAELDEQVRDRFREMKTYAAVASRAKARSRAEAAKREAASTEEQLLLRWGREPR